MTRDYGNQVLVEKSLDDLTESGDAIRVLDDNADVETRYGGDFVQSVDGLEGGTPGGRSFDWFFSVNGIVSEVGGAEFPVNAGDQVWWDYRDWTDAMEVGAVVGAFPAPMSTGYRGSDWPVSVECLDSADACRRVKERLTEAGVDADISVDGMSPTGDTLRFVVGTWDRVKADTDASRIESDPSSSGIFARFDSDGGSNSLIGLDQEGHQAENFGSDAGLIAAARRGEGAPVWFVTGGSEAGVETAASALTRTDLEHRYAAAVKSGQVVSLPVL
ncbi:MAG: DUF4430 domain-containing protein [Solirubrobacterales bacterium]|nr:DUF4430 domain-containing protein [Solirubrobacterales bacterium]